MKFCTDCVHFSGYAWERCRHPAARDVLGASVSARLERRSEGGCGPEAARFESKPLWKRLTFGMWGVQ